ncbi:MAG: hypothetical protein NVS4B3_14200 [Gemmatimonadaceae bacterium]
MLPPRDDPGFEEAAARALLEAKVAGETGSAESATGFYWGDHTLRPTVSRLLASARLAGDDALVQAAEQFLR